MLPPSPAIGYPTTTGPAASGIARRGIRQAHAALSPSKGGRASRPPGAPPRRVAEFVAPTGDRREACLFLCQHGNSSFHSYRHRAQEIEDDDEDEHDSLMREHNPATGGHARADSGFSLHGLRAAL